MKPFYMVNDRESQAKLYTVLFYYCAKFYDLVVLLMDAYSDVWYHIWQFNYASIATNVLNTIMYQTCLILRYWD